jgi:hypothetical protein
LEVLLIDDLVLLGVRTTCLGTEDPCNYRHSLLLDARHKNVYNKVVRAKRSRWTRSKSPFKVRTEVPTTSEILVTPDISGIPASIEEVQRQQKDNCIDPSLKTSTCLTEPVPSETGPQSLVVQTTVAVEATPSSAPEIFYGPDGLPLPPGLIAIEEIVEDQQANTPIHFGVGTTVDI